MSLGKDTLSMLVMPCSKTRLSLYLCWVMNSQKHATIKIFDTEDDEKHNKFARFFHTLKFAVGFISSLKIKSKYFQVDPLYNDEDIETNPLDSQNVYCKGDQVYKPIDTVTEDWAKPNENIIKDVLNDYLPDIVFFNFKIRD